MEALRWCLFNRQLVLQMISLLRLWGYWRGRVCRIAGLLSFITFSRIRIDAGQSFKGNTFM